MRSLQLHGIGNILGNVLEGTARSEQADETVLCMSMPGGFIDSLPGRQIDLQEALGSRANMAGIAVAYDSEYRIPQWLSDHYNQRPIASISRFHKARGRAKKFSLVQ